MIGLFLLGWIQVGNHAWDRPDGGPKIDGIEIRNIETNIFLVSASLEPIHFRTPSVLSIPNHTSRTADRMSHRLGNRHPVALDLRSGAKTTDDTPCLLRRCAYQPEFLAWRRA